MCCVQLEKYLSTSSADQCCLRSACLPHAERQDACLTVDEAGEHFKAGCTGPALMLCDALCSNDMRRRLTQSQLDMVAALQQKALIPGSAGQEETAKWLLKHCDVSAAWLRCIIAVASAGAPSVDGWLLQAAGAWD